jgi:ubiquinone/menaquinone biosynthesis C-methylase UbiE
MEEQRGRTEEERAYYALNREVYGAFAPFYELVTLPVRRLRDEVARTLLFERGARVLDVATGTGAQARAFAARGAEVVGIDISEAMLRVARRKTRLPNVTFQRADATELPFEDRSFDVACVSFALHEMPPSVRERAVREMVRVTKSGGAIVIVDYALPQNAAARELVYHIVKLYERDQYAEFVRSDLRALLRDAGVDVQAPRPVLGGIATIYTGRPLQARESVARSSQVEPRANGASRASARDVAGALAPTSS